MFGCIDDIHFDRLLIIYRTNTAAFCALACPAVRECVCVCFVVVAHGDFRANDDDDDDCVRMSVPFDGSLDSARRWFGRAPSLWPIRTPRSARLSWGSRLNMNGRMTVCVSMCVFKALGSLTLRKRTLYWELSEREQEARARARTQTLAS